VCAADVPDVSSTGTERGDSPAVVLTRDAGAIITDVDEGVIGLLGWTPEELVGLPSTTFVHPEDQPSAIAAWMKMISEPGSIRVWRGRYRAADGSWRWVETVNENRLHDPERVVRTSMSRVTVEQVGIEEELRARKQLLSRLSDALPVGVVQIDAGRTVTFTNDRFHSIVDGPPAATIDTVLAGVVPDDRPLLEAALTAVLAGQPVDDIELRLEAPADRVCLLSLRTLTDGDGDVSGAIGCLSDVTDRVNLRRELEIRASIDTLTSCLNRAATLDLLTVILARHDGTGPGTAVVFIDLDHFKSVNDRYGHAAGDRMLTVAAECLRATVRGFDQVGRLGGDEFLVICPGVESAAKALEIGERLAEMLHVEVDVGSAVVDLEASVGVAWTAALIDADALIAQADSAMYASKSSKTCTTTLFAGVSASR
jgi:diguanylate cyclase (GGDEF)-like protein/PAS domain S-box-containing protein